MTRPPVLAVVPGVCRFCAHTDEEPRKDETGGECGWHTRERDVCTARGCVLRLIDERREVRRRDREALSQVQRKVAGEFGRQRADRERKRKARMLRQSRWQGGRA